MDLFFWLVLYAFVFVVNRFIISNSLISSLVAMYQVTFIKVPRQLIKNSFKKSTASDLYAILQYLCGCFPAYALFEYFWRDFVSPFYFLREPQHGSTVHKDTATDDGATQ